MVQLAAVLDLICTGWVLDFARTMNGATDASVSSCCTGLPMKFVLVKGSSIETRWLEVGY